MGLFDGIAAANNARKAHKAHTAGNQYASKGMVKEAEAEHENARLLYQKAVDCGLDNPSYLMGYGMLLLRLYRFKEAEAIFLRTEKCLKPTAVERQQLKINMGLCQWKLGNLDAAIKHMKEVHTMNPNGIVYGSLGYILIEKAQQTGDFTEATEYNQEALEYDNEDSVILDNVGLLNLVLGDRDKALEYFSKAHEIKPTQVDTLYHLGLMAKENGNPKTARKYLEQAIKGNYSALCVTTHEQAQKLLDSIK